MGRKVLDIPEPDYRLRQILGERRAENIEYDMDANDANVYEGIDPRIQSEVTPIVSRLEPLVTQKDWEHDSDWVMSCSLHRLPPPEDASVMATRAVQRELMTMIKEQDNAEMLDELGWYIPQELMGDNLFQWIIEFHSFPSDLPLAKDMINQ